MLRLAYGFTGYRAKQFENGPAGNRMAQLRGNLREWFEYEAPLFHPWMGNGKIRRYDDEPPVKENVNINRTGTIGHQAPAPHFALDVLQPAHEGARQNPGLAFQNHVVEQWLVRLVHRPGFVHGREGGDCNARTSQFSDRLPQVLQTIS